MIREVVEVKFMTDDGRLFSDLRLAEEHERRLKGEPECRRAGEHGKFVQFELFPEYNGKEDNNEQTGAVF